jgi:hypothetical protein
MFQTKRNPPEGEARSVHYSERCQARDILIAAMMITHVESAGTTSRVRCFGRHIAFRKEILESRDANSA